MDAITKSSWGMLELYQKGIAVVFHEGNHTGSPRRQRIIVVLVGIPLIACPVAAFDVQDEAIFILAGPVLPAEIDSPERGGLAVGELGEDLPVTFDLRGPIRCLAAVLHETHGRTNVVAEPDSLLLVAVDSVPTLRGDVLQAEKLIQSSRSGARQ